MNTTTKNCVTNTDIYSLGKDFDDLSVITMEDYCGKYGAIIMQPHRAPFYRIFILSEGNGRIWKDSNEYIFTSKSLFTVAKGQVASFEFEEMPKGYVLLFSEEFVNRNSGDLDWLNNLNLFDFSVELPVSSLTGMEYFELLVFIRKIKMELETRNDYVTCEIVYNLFKTFILVVERLNTKRIELISKDSGDKTYINEFKKKLEEMYNNSRTVNYYADELGITPRKLNQITYSYCGVSAKQLIEDRVLLETKRLLVHTQLTIKEIGHSLGFNDPTNFNKFFKRYIKLTPLEFRDLNKKTYRVNKTTDNNHFQPVSLVDN